MDAPRIAYRKLPGHRRGIFNGSSLWLGPDHLLLVRSQRFKEEYRRFYLRDIQAIAAARANRFHLSTRSLVIGWAWFLALSASLFSAWVWLVGLALAGLWFYLSVQQSCVVRIYTAASSELLPSLYRRRTVRKFLEQVEPLIREVQGNVDPAAVEAAEEPRVGPGFASPAGAEPASSVLSILDAGAPAEKESMAVTSGDPRTVSSMVFLASLLVQAALDAAGFRASIPGLASIAAVLALVQCGAAVLVFVDRSRGRLRAPIHNVAIAKLAWLTVLFYLDTGFYAARQVTVSPLIPATDVLRGLDLVLSIAMCAAGVALSMRSNTQRPGLLGS